MSERTFSDEVLRRLNELDSARFEAMFRDVWLDMAPHQNVTDLLPQTEAGRMVWRMAFSQTLVNLVDPHFRGRP